MKVDERLIPRVVERMRALADESRLRLMLRLKQGECNVSTLTDELGIALVEVERRGTQAVYRVCDESVFDLCKLVCDGVIRQLKREQAVLAGVRGGDGRVIFRK